MNSGISANLVRAVMEELCSDPRLGAEKINVCADGAGITLTGAVRSYSEKCLAAAIAREIRGVSGVRNALEVRLPIGSYRTDAGLERLSSEILENHSALCDPLPTVSASGGWLTLDGVVSSDAQKRTVEVTLRDVAGVRGITNRIEIVPRPAGSGAAAAFEASVRRRSAPAVEELKAEVSGMTLSVYGRVSSCADHDALIELASRRRGIARVEDHIVVRPSWPRHQAGVS